MYCSGGEESAKSKPEKKPTHTHTHDDNRSVCFVCNCNFRARFSSLRCTALRFVVGAKQTFSFLINFFFSHTLRVSYGIVSNSMCVLMWVSVCVYLLYECVLVYRIFFFFFGFFMLFSSILFCNFVHVLRPSASTFVYWGNYCLSHAARRSFINRVDRSDVDVNVYVVVVVVFVVCQKEQRLFLSPNRTHVCVVGLTKADWRDDERCATDWSDDRLFAANMLEASERNRSVVATLTAMRINRAGVALRRVWSSTRRRHSGTLQLNCWAKSNMFINKHKMIASAGNGN